MGCERPEYESITIMEGWSEKEIGKIGKVLKFQLFVKTSESLFTFHMKATAVWFLGFNLIFKSL